jgi:hypothetical protein
VGTGINFKTDFEVWYAKYDKNILQTLLKSGVVRFQQDEQSYWTPEARISSFSKWNGCYKSPWDYHPSFNFNWNVSFVCSRVLVCHVNCDYTYNNNPSPSEVNLFRGGLLLNQLFDQFLFLNEECSYNPILDTICTARTTVSTLYCLFVLGKTSVFTGTESWNLHN